MNQDKITIVENFFDNFCNIKNKFSNIGFYNNNDYCKLSGKNKDENIFPGKRSLDIFEINPFFCNLILKEFQLKFNNFYQGNNFNMQSYLHLRLTTDNEKDYIHTDPCTHTLIIYLSETNLNSGTIIYDNNKNPSLTINFVQNRAVIFPGNFLHMSMLNYGDNINNGRLTLNCFFHL
jgi:hypothetical protein